MNNVLNEASISYRPWNNLSMQEKAAMIRVAVKNGLTDLKSIREKYNEFAGGGRKRGQESINNAATQQAMQYFMGKGLTDYQAAGLVGNLFRESRLIPTATNTGSGAYGIAQWLGARKKNLFAKYGKNPTLNQQLDYVWHELGNTHRMGLKAIKSSKNAEEAARNAMGYYEFSAGPEAAIREMRKWGQDGEGAMQKGINFASQLLGGPVVPFRTETPQWNNIPFTPANPEVFFGNPVTTSQPVIDIEPTRTSMIEYDPKETERQEKRDNLNSFNMFLGMLNGSNESIFPFSMFAGGGDIHIKPENRGKFTALKERTGHSATWFKEHGTPAQKKMATFALNARHWKHGLGGNLFDDGGPKKPFTRDDLRGMLQRRRAEAEAVYNGSVTETQITPNDNAWVDKPLTRRKKNPYLSRRAEEGARAHAAWEREHPNLAAWGNLAGAIPFAVAAAPLGAGIVAGGDALAATTAGQAITSGLAPLYQAATNATIAGAPALTWADVGLRSAFGAHGLQQAVEDGGISPMTALELTPVLQIANPVAKGAVTAAKTAYDNGTLWDAYTTFGGRFGNYRDNIFTNMYGTAARRFGLPDKARIPADGIRKIADEPRTLNGLVNLTGNKEWFGSPHINATIDRPVVSHASGWDGMDTYLFPFRDFVSKSGKALKSVEPSDVFSNGVLFMEEPSRITLISGDVEALQRAKDAGMQTLSSPKLRRLYSNADNVYEANRLLNKPPKKSGYWKDYADEVQRLQSQRGTPTMADFKLLEQETGLTTGVAPLSEYDNAYNRLNRMMSTMKDPKGIRMIMNGEAIPYVYPNGREVNWVIQDVFDELRALQRAKYNNVFYDPTTYTESIWRSESKPKW